MVPRGTRTDGAAAGEGGATGAATATKGRSSAQRVSAPERYGNDMRKAPFRHRLPYRRANRLAPLVALSLTFITLELEAGSAELKELTSQRKDHNWRPRSNTAAL